MQNVVNSCVNQKSFCSNDSCPESFISGNGRSLASLSNPCVHTNSELSNSRQKATTSRIQTSFRSGSGQYREGTSTNQSNQSNLKVDFAVKEGSQSSVVTNEQTHEKALKYKLPPASKRWYYKDPNEIIQGTWKLLLFRWIWFRYSLCYNFLPFFHFVVEFYSSCRCFGKLIYDILGEFSDSFRNYNLVLVRFIIFCSVYNYSCSFLKFWCKIVYNFQMTSQFYIIICLVT